MYESKGGETATRKHTFVTELYERGLGPGTSIVIKYHQIIYQQTNSVSQHHISGAQKITTPRKCRYSFCSTPPKYINVTRCI